MVCNVRVLPAKIRRVYATRAGAEYGWAFGPGAFVVVPPVSGGAGATLRIPAYKCVLS